MWCNDQVNRRLAIQKMTIAGAGLLVARLPGWNSADERTYTIRSEVRLVLLDVSVKDRDGGFVSGLSKDNFSVHEEGRPQNITVFDHNDLPVTVGLLVDDSLSMTRKRGNVLTAAQTFIEQSNRNDEVFVLHFNDKVTPGLPPQTLFSGDLQQLRSALYRGVAEGKTALNDAVLAGLKQLELGRRDKKALIVISDGGDNASEHSRGEMLGAVERSIATLYTIGLFDADDPDQDPGILRQLARISGGEAYFPADSLGMVPVCRRIAQDIRTRYTIGYLPEGGNNRRASRRIRVRVSAPGHAKLFARTRDSYRYDQVETQENK
jgi:Ca-activated chloride channel family protein